MNSIISIVRLCKDKVEKKQQKYWSLLPASNVDNGNEDKWIQFYFAVLIANQLPISEN